MKIISRKEAVIQGLTFYFTNRPCPHGHISHRYASNGACCECLELNGKRIRSVSKRFYVYAYLDEDGCPYYIGKGQRRRAWEPHGDIVVPPDSRIAILKKRLTNSESLELEAALIANYGMTHNGTGCLQNEMSKGSRGAVGKKVPPDVIAKRAAKMRGRKVSPEVRARIGAAHAAPRRWYHPDHGEVVAGASELSQMLFGDSSHNAMFVMVYKGRRRIHYGWTCLNPEKPFVWRKKPATVYTWRHPEHGLFRGSERDLVAAFPEQRLAQGNLNRVRRGQHRHAKGWEFMAA